MAVSNMYDFVSTVAPDIADILTVNPYSEYIEIGQKRQIAHIGEDGSEQRISFSDDTIFYITLQWQKLSAVDGGTIFNLYHNATKANGIMNSFSYAFPDGHSYVVRFTVDPFSRVVKPPNVQGFSLKLRVMGKI